ncbi:MAG TPA: accessory factor UbiK family protein [Gammaproteobacteria bacterium]|nr:accessory factor UbiK family protein [Gammaproteobacteria bacterium]
MSRPLFADRLDSLLQGLLAFYPNASSPFREELKKNARTWLSATLTRMELVTREEFDVQTALLSRTRQRLEELERQVAALEAAGQARHPDSTA